MLYILLIAVMLLLCFIDVVSRVLAEIFTTVAFMTCIIARIEPFWKKV